MKIIGASEVIKRLSSCPEGAGKEVTFDLDNLYFHAEPLSYYDKSELPQRRFWVHEVSLGLCYPDIYKNTDILYFLTLSKLKNELSLSRDPGNCLSLDRRKLREKKLRQAIKALELTGAQDRAQYYELEAPELTR